MAIGQINEIKLTGRKRVYQGRDWDRWRGVPTTGTGAISLALRRVKNRGSEEEEGSRRRRKGRLWERFYSLRVAPRWSATLPTPDPMPRASLPAEWTGEKKEERRRKKKRREEKRRRARALRVLAQRPSARACAENFFFFKHGCYNSPPLNRISSSKLAKRLTNSQKPNLRENPEEEHPLN